MCTINHILVAVRPSLSSVKPFMFADKYWPLNPSLQILSGSYTPLPRTPRPDPLYSPSTPVLLYDIVLSHLLHSSPTPVLLYTSPVSSTRSGSLQSPTILLGPLHSPPIAILFYTNRGRKKKLKGMKEPIFVIKKEEKGSGREENARGK